MNYPTRRQLVAEIGMMGSGLAESPTASIAKSSTGTEEGYRADIRGAVPRSLTARLSERISVMDFGAVGDGATDDTRAIQRAAEASAAAGKALFLPATRRGYLVTDTIELRVRRIYGDGEFLNSRNPGTFIRFRPTVGTEDMIACFAIVDGMYGSGLVENLSVVGTEEYSRAGLRRCVDPARLPNYAAFAPGACAFMVKGANQPSFRNVSTRGVKAGLLLDSTNGHVSSYDCHWYGLFGVYCRRNSEDYFFLGGSINGVWANVVFGTQEWANHVGGMHISAYNVHMGFAPYGFYQVKDAPFSGATLSLYGRLDLVRFERIGEAIFQFLQQSVTDALAVDGFGFSWSPIYREFPKNPDGWKTNLPPEIIPYDEQQLYAMRFGALGGNVKLGWLGDLWPVRRSPWNKMSLGIAVIERMDLRDGADLSALNDDYTLKSAPTPRSWTRRRGGPVAKMGDLTTDAGIAPSGNLLRNPEVLENWEIHGGTAGQNALSTMGLTDIGLVVPLGLKEELGDDPAVINIVPSGNRDLRCSIPLVRAPLDVHGRSVCVTFWLTGRAIRCRLALTDGQYLYDDTYRSENAWRKVVCVDQTAVGSKLLAFEIAGVDGAQFSVCGVMVSLDAPKIYNSSALPRIRHGLAFQEALVDTVAPRAGTADPLPSAPAGYLAIEIDGVSRKIPYF